MRSPATSSELERICACGRSVCTTTFGARGSLTSTAVKFFGRALVREPEDPAAVAGELHRHALAHPAEAVQAVVGKELHVQEHGGQRYAKSLARA